MTEAESREAQVARAFVAIADTLTTDFDVVDLLHTLLERCTSILDTDEGGLMLADGAGELQVMTSTSEAADLVEMMQLASFAGPCIECFTTGAPVTIADITIMDGRWPEFREVALHHGFRSAHATPMRLRGEILGTVNLFGREVGALDAPDIALAQALTDVATISILQERVSREVTLVTEQLHHALDSRVLIEQAKGMVAYSMSISVDEAFSVLRAYSRSNNLALRKVAEAISHRTLQISALVPHVGSPKPKR